MASVFRAICFLMLSVLRISMAFSSDDGKVQASQGPGCEHPGPVDPGLVGDHQNFVWPKSVLELAMECHEVSRLVSKCQDQIS